MICGADRLSTQRGGKPTSRTHLVSALRATPRTSTLGMLALCYQQLDCRHFSRPAVRARRQICQRTGPHNHAGRGASLCVAAGPDGVAAGTREAAWSLCWSATRGSSTDPWDFTTQRDALRRPARFMTKRPSTGIPRRQQGTAGDRAARPAEPSCRPATPRGRAPRGAPLQPLVG